MCAERDNFELHGREKYKITHLCVYHYRKKEKENMTEDSEFLHRQVLGGGNEMWGPEKEGMKLEGYICLKSFNLKST